MKQTLLALTFLIFGAWNCLAQTTLALEAEITQGQKATTDVDLYAFVERKGINIVLNFSFFDGSSGVTALAFGKSIQLNKQTTLMPYFGFTSKKQLFVPLVLVTSLCARPIEHIADFRLDSKTQMFTLYQKNTVSITVDSKWRIRNDIFVTRDGLQSHKLGIIRRFQNPNGRYFDVVPYYDLRSRQVGGILTLHW